MSDTEIENLQAFQAPDEPEKQLQQAPIYPEIRPSQIQSFKPQKLIDESSESVDISECSSDEAKSDEKPLDIKIDLNDNVDMFELPRQLSDPKADAYFNENVQIYDFSEDTTFKTSFGLISYYMVMTNCVLSLFMGFSGVYIGRNDKTSPALDINLEYAEICGYYAFVSGFVISIIESVIWNYHYTTPNMFKYRGIIYFITGIFPFGSFTTGLVGLFWFLTALVSIAAYEKMEDYTSLRTRKKRKTKFDCNAFVKNIFYKLKNLTTVRYFTFLICYSAFVGWYMWERYTHYVDFKEIKNARGKAYSEGTSVNPDANDVLYGAAYDGNRNKLVLSGWFPIAKMFGNLLDINCAFIVLPVCRSFIRILYNKSTDQRRSSRALNFVLSYIPLDKALQFHKVCAALTVIGTIFHGWAHYNHYAQVPETYEAVFGPTVWISGIIIIMSMFFLYSTSFQQVRHGKFELFWYTHHLFIVFFVTILFHGAGSINPNFWKWFLVPGLLYLVERVMREIRASKPIGVVSITHMNNVAAKVFCLELEKKPGQPTHQHQEGQYVFICAPIVSKYQWHPFTISSPPDQKTLTLHIRNMGDGTWTGRLQDFFQALAPRKAYAELFHREAFSLVPQTKAPDGSNLICVDGPMAAPTQHLGEYGTSIVCGAGIGVTPVRATLLSIVFYRFKRGIGQTFPDHAYMVWIVNYKQLDAYRFMVRCLKEAEDEMYDMRAKNPKTMNEKTLQIHVFVTSSPKEPFCDLSEVANPDNSRDKDLELWGPPYNQIANRDNPNNDNKKKNSTRSSVGNSSLQKTEAPFTLIDIWRCLKEPQDNPVAIGDIIVHKGRPKWGELFGPIQQHHKGEKIGVMFCGPAIIAKQLKEECGNHTDFDSDTVFILHKENF